MRFGLESREKKGAGRKLVNVAYGGSLSVNLIYKDINMLFFESSNGEHM